MVNEEIKIYCDGGSRGNPGPSAAGVVFVDNNDKVVAQYNEYLGEQTNNFAEYSAVLLALKHIDNYKNSKIKFFLDSQLVVQQLKGAYKVKSDNIKPLYHKIISQIEVLDVEFTHVLREYNKLADEQVNICLDSQSID